MIPVFSFFLLLIPHVLGGFADPDCLVSCQWDLSKPVCGVDGVTRPNRCEAECDRVEVACDGECPCEQGGRPQYPTPNLFTGLDLYLSIW